MVVQVETPSGKLTGREQDGVRTFLGIPYAEPPVGPRRFGAPQPVRPWAGVRDASAFGSSAPQAPMLLPLPGMDVGPIDEDCLYLNVFAPSGGAARKPVLVWIHGGGFVIGSGCQSVYDGRALARRGDVVVVTINYRLGALGFLHLGDLCPGLDGAVSNPGMRDQIAALEWVRSHIAAFGGDPQQVTIFGESAGGMSVGTLLGMPAARGLFQRAIPQSGATHHFHTREAATKVADACLRLLGIAPADARALREVPVGRWIDTQVKVQVELATSLGLLPFQPVADGESLPSSALKPVRDGACADVALMTGTTRDEWKLFTVMDPSVSTLDEPKLLARLGRDVPEVDADALYAAYRDARQARGQSTAPLELFAAIQTDRTFRIPAIRLAEAQAAHQPRTFVYRMDWESPMLGGVLGACHAVELPFVFGTYALPGGDQFAGAGPEVEALSARMMDAWLAFARSGDPGFPAYDAEKRTTMIFGRECGTQDDPQAAERKVWEGRL